mmetsp:Transcript_52971/g.151021  ORF Transcript_52971/g.151021 Transcript_52971/m.151021 type:complete len:250 (+) Transcript_52971:1482-2231(+)
MCSWATLTFSFDPARASFAAASPARALASEELASALLALASCAICSAFVTLSADSTLKFAAFFVSLSAPEVFCLASWWPSLAFCFLSFAVFISSSKVSESVFDCVRSSSSACFALPRSSSSMALTAPGSSGFSAGSFFPFFSFFSLAPALLSARLLLAPGAARTPACPLPCPVHHAAAPTTANTAQPASTVRRAGRVQRRTSCASPASRSEPTRRMLARSSMLAVPLGRESARAGFGPRRVSADSAPRP